MSDHPWDPHDLAFEEQERAAQYHFGESRVRQNGDRFVESVECFEVILAPPELFDEDIIMKRFVAAVNIAGNDTVDDSLNGYYERELFDLSEEG
jgi:hypothetical protein